MKLTLTVLLIVAFVLIQCMIGGTRFVFSLPIYTLLGVAGLLTLFRRPAVDSRPSLWCLGVSAVFFGYILIRAALSPVEYLWWNDFYMVLACLVVYLVTTFYLTKVRERSMVVWALFALALVEVFIGLRQFSGGDNWMPFGFMRADYARRASGMLISSIHLAGYLEVVAMFALSFAFWSTWKTWKRIFAGYIAVLCFIGVAITGSRGGYLSIAFAVVVFTAISLHVRRKTRPATFRIAALIIALATVVGIVGAVVIMTQNSFLRHRLSMIPQQLEEKGLDVRIHMWKAALDQFHLSPWLGTGAGTHLYYGRYFRRPPLQGDPIHAHSDYLELLAEYGIVGAAGMLAFLLVHLRIGWRNYRTVIRNELTGLSPYEPARHNALALYIACLCAIAAYLAHSVTDFNLHVPGHALIFAFIFGCIASPDLSVAPGSKRLGAALFRWSLPALGLWLLLVGIAKFPGEYYAEKARVAFRNFQFAEAIRFAGEALRYEEGNPELFFSLGGAHRGAGQIAEEKQAEIAHLEAAVDAYERGLLIFPQDVHTLIRLGETLTDLGRFQEAERMFLAALKLDKNFGRAHAIYAIYLETVGRAEEAAASLAHARSFSQHDGVIDRLISGTVLDPRMQTE